MTKPGFVGVPYASGSETSRAAAESMLGLVKGLKRRVLGYLAANAEAGATTDEIEVFLGGRHQSISPRVNELVAAGMIVDSGKTRKTRSGRMAVVYEIASDPPPSTSTLDRDLVQISRGLVKLQERDQIKLDIGKRLKKAREHRGLGIRDLARLADVDHSNLSKLERGGYWAEPLVEACLKALSSPQQEVEG